jgi:amino acid transporter
MATEQPVYEKLGQANLRFVDVVAQTVGFMGPVFGSILLIALVVGANAAEKGAGVSTPVAIIIAAIGVAALGWIIAAYAKRIHAAGALYDYVSAGAGEHIGFVFGWIYLGGLIVLAVAIPLLWGGLLSDFLKGSYSVGIPYWILDLAYTAILFAVLYFGVRLSTRAQLTLVLISASVVTIFLIYVIAKVGGGNSVKPFTPSESHGFGNMFYGVLYAILLFVGFESAANLAEETNEPKRYIPRAVLFSIFVVGGYFLVASYAQAVGFHLNASKWAAAGTPGPLIVLAGPGKAGGYGSSWFYDVMNILLILDVAAVGIGASVAASRVMFSLARDRRIPGAFAGVSKRYGTPSASIATVVIIAVAEILWVRLGHGVLSEVIPGVPPNVAKYPEYFPLFSWLAGYGSLSLVVIYAAVAIASLRGLWNKVNNASLLLAVVVGTAVAGGAVYASVYHVPSPLNWVPWITLAWAAIGVIILLALVGTKNFRQSATAAGAVEVTPDMATAAGRPPGEPVPPLVP